MKNNKENTLKLLLSALLVITALLVIVLVIIIPEGSISDTAEINSGVSNSDHPERVSLTESDSRKTVLKTMSGKYSAQQENSAGLGSSSDKKPGPVSNSDPSVHPLTEEKYEKKKTAVQNSRSAS